MLLYTNPALSAKGGGLVPKPGESLVTGSRNSNRGLSASADGSMFAWVEGDNRVTIWCEGIMTTANIVPYASSLDAWLSPAGTHLYVARDSATTVCYTVTRNADNSVSCAMLTIYSGLRSSVCYDYAEWGGFHARRGSSVTGITCWSSLPATGVQAWNKQQLNCYAMALGSIGFVISESAFPATVRVYDPTTGTQRAAWTQSSEYVGLAGLLTPPAVSDILLVQENGPNKSYQTFRVMQLKGSVFSDTRVAINPPRNAFASWGQGVGGCAVSNTGKILAVREFALNDRGRVDIFKPATAGGHDWTFAYSLRAPGSLLDQSLNQIALSANGKRLACDWSNSGVVIHDTGVLDEVAA